MAVHLLSGYLDPPDAASALSQLTAAHREIYHDITPAAAVDTGEGWDSAIIMRAIRSPDPHQVKLVEACRRGLLLTGDPRFFAAARRVTEPCGELDAATAGRRRPIS
jgi:hypothetical protein